MTREAVMRAADERVGVVGGVALLLIVCCGALSGLLDTLLVPLYAGSVIVPVAVLLAVLGNIALPLLARLVRPRTGIAALPFAAWLVVVIGFGTVTRPEGDVILPGSPAGAEWVTYGVLLLGALAGAGTLVVTGQPPIQQKPPVQQAHQGRAGTKPGGGSRR